MNQMGYTKDNALDESVNFNSNEAINELKMKKEALRRKWATLQKLQNDFVHELLDEIIPR